MNGSRFAALSLALLAACQVTAEPPARAATAPAVAAVPAVEHTVWQPTPAEAAVLSGIEMLRGYRVPAPKLRPVARGFARRPLTGAEWQGLAVRVAPEQAALRSARQGFNDASVVAIKSALCRGDYVVKPATGYSGPRGMDAFLAELREKLGGVAERDFGHTQSGSRERGTIVVYLVRCRHDDGYFAARDAVVVAHAERRAKVVAYLGEVGAR